MKPWHEYTPQGVEDLADEALNEAVRYIQDKLGVETGDLAGLFFSGVAERGMKELLTHYIRSELKAHEDAA
jgi:hypothetical protein